VGDYDVRGRRFSVNIKCDITVLFMIVKAKKNLIPLFFSSSMVNCIVGVAGLKLLRNSLILVKSMLYTIKISSTYRK
jgi:hypothetical protein